MAGDDEETREDDSDGNDGGSGGDLVDPQVIDAEIVESAPRGALGLTPSSADEAGALMPLAALERFQLARLRSRKELEAMEIVLDSRLDELRHAAGARSEESKARWNARTAEVVSGLKTVVQASLRDIENERMGGRFESIEKAYEAFAAKVRDVESGTLPDALRQDLVAKLRQNLEATIKRLEDDSIADRYDLTD